MIERRTPQSRDDYRTPAEEIALVKRIFGGTIDLDPCADRHKKHWIARTNFTGSIESVDGLEARWLNNVFWSNNVFINPPYGSALPKWVYKGWWEHSAERTTSQLWLVPARPGSRWWNKLMSFCPIFAVKNKRIIFKGETSGAGFPSALAYCGSNEPRFIAEVTAVNWKVYRPV